MEPVLLPSLQEVIKLRFPSPPARTSSGRSMGQLEMSTITLGVHIVMPLCLLDSLQSLKVRCPLFLTT